MNPISLLTKGRTIRGLKERPGRYKLLCDSALPNFSGPKNLFPTTTHPEPEKVQPPVDRTERTDITKRTLEEGDGTGMPVGVGPAQENPLKAGLRSCLAVVHAGWVHQWIPWRKTPPIPSTSIQTELVLEKVKVIRNDLSEDDLEVVMMEKKVVRKTEKIECEKLTAHP
jgi:hypothetical protein